MVTVISDHSAVPHGFTVLSARAGAANRRVIQRPEVGRDRAHA